MGEEMDDEPDENDKDKGNHLSLRFQRLGQRFVEGSFDAFDIFMKVLGPIFIVIAIALVSFVSHTFFMVILPSMASGGSSPHTRMALSMTGVVLLANITYNYALTICTDPGLPPEYDTVRMEEEDIIGRADSRESCPHRDDADEEPRGRQCGRCGRQKPERTHHCSVCKRCVLKMDHHCPWVNNCVGFRNYRHFCLFMWWLALGCLFIVVMTYDIFVEAMFRPRYSRHSFETRQMISLATVISACIFFSLLMLGGFHLYLVLTNQTTIEFHGNMGRRDDGRKHGVRWRNPYDLGRARNFQQVFGSDDICRFRWVLPCMSTLPGDGLRFPTTSSHEQW